MKVTVNSNDTRKQQQLIQQQAHVDRKHHNAQLRAITAMCNCGDRGETSSRNPQQQRNRMNPSLSHSFLQPSTALQQRQPPPNSLIIKKLIKKTRKIAICTNILNKMVLWLLMKKICSLSH